MSFLNHRTETSAFTVEDCCDDVYQMTGDDLLESGTSAFGTLKMTVTRPEQQTTTMEKQIHMNGDDDDDMLLKASGTVKALSESLEVTDLAASPKHSEVEDAVRQSSMPKVFSLPPLAIHIHHGSTIAGHSTAGDSATSPLLATSSSNPCGVQLESERRVKMRNSLWVHSRAGSVSPTPRHSSGSYVLDDVTSFSGGDDIHHPPQQQQQTAISTVAIPTVFRVPSETKRSGWISPRGGGGGAIPDEPRVFSLPDQVKSETPPLPTTASPNGSFFFARSRTSPSSYVRNEERPRRSLRSLYTLLPLWPLVVATLVAIVLMLLLRGVVSRQQLVVESNANELMSRVDPTLQWIISRDYAQTVAGVLCLRRSLFDDLVLSNDTSLPLALEQLASDMTIRSGRKDVVEATCTLVDANGTTAAVPTSSLSYFNPTQSGGVWKCQSRLSSTPPSAIKNVNVRCTAAAAAAAEAGAALPTQRYPSAYNSPRELRSASSMSYEYHYRSSSGATGAIADPPFSTASLSQISTIVPGSQRLLQSVDLPASPSTKVMLNSDVFLDLYATISTTEYPSAICVPASHTSTLYGFEPSARSPSLLTVASPLHMYGYQLLVEVFVAAALFASILTIVTKGLLDVGKVVGFVANVLDVFLRAHVKLSTLAPLDDDESITVRGELALCFRSVDINVLTQSLNALALKQQEFRTYLPRGFLSQKLVVLQSHHSSSRGASPQQHNASGSDSPREGSRDGAHNPFRVPRPASLASPRGGLHVFAPAAGASNDPIIQFGPPSITIDQDELFSGSGKKPQGLPQLQQSSPPPPDEFEDDTMLNLNEYEGIMVSFGLQGPLPPQASVNLQASSPHNNNNNTDVMGYSASTAGRGRSNSIPFAHIPNSSGAHEMSPTHAAISGGDGAIAGGGGGGLGVSHRRARGYSGVHQTFESVADFPFASPNIAALIPPEAPIISIMGPNEGSSMGDQSTRTAGSSEPPPAALSTQAPPPFVHGGIHPAAARRNSASLLTPASELEQTAASATQSCLPPPALTGGVFGAMSHSAHTDALHVAVGGDPMGMSASRHRSSTNREMVDLAQATQNVNHLAHSGVRRATFVCCQLQFPGCGSHSAITGEISKERLSMLEAVGKLFMSLFTEVCGEFQGSVYRMTLFSVVMTFNTFEPCPFHEARGCLAALHLAKELQERFDTEAIVLSSFVKWGICVNSGAAVVGIAGTNQKMAPVISSDALTIAQSTSRLCSIIHCHVLVLEPCYHVSRTQVFCLPVDVIGHEGAQIIVFELKGRWEEFRSVKEDYQPLMDGFACLVVHKFEEAIQLLSQVLHMDSNAVRLLELALWCHRVEGTAASILPKPYHRQLPMWESPEVLADHEELQDDVRENMLMHRRMIMMSPTNAQSSVMHSKPHRLSALADSILRSHLERRNSDLGGPNNGAMSPFLASGEAPWSFRNSLDFSPTAGTNPGSRKSSQETSSAPYTPSETHVGVSTLDRSRSSTVLPVEILDKKNALWLRTERLLGQGAFGAVYQGLAENGALVAMKVLPLNVSEIRAYRSSIATLAPGASPPTARPPLPPHIEEVLKEVSLLSQLVHPNIVQYLTSTISHNFLFIMTEFMSGGTLTRMVQMFGSLSETVIRRYAKDILEGLKFLHSKKIVHRDINPNNVLLTLDGVCKLSDFGAATGTLQKRGADAVRQRRLSDESRFTSRSTSISDSTAETPIQGQTPPSSSLLPSSQTPLTATATVGDNKILGTPLFMAPEACRGSATAASDVWGFGVILCYCFSGVYPYPEADYADVDSFLRRLAYDESYGPTIPNVPNVAAMSLMRQCLQRQESLRPTVSDMLMHPFLIQ